MKKKSFPMMFSALLEDCTPFSSNLKLLSANCFYLEESKIVLRKRLNDHLVWVYVLISNNPDDAGHGAATIT